MENNNMKTFNIDGIKVSIPMSLYKEAVKVHVFDEENTEEDKEGNRICLRSIIAAAFRESLDDLDKITFKSVKSDHTEEEISKAIQPIVIDNIRLYGGYYDIT